MPTRNINLTDALDAFVAEAVKSGAYQNASEVIRAALRLLRAEEDLRAEKRAQLDAALAEAEADLAAGRFEDVKDIGAWLDRVEAEAATLAERRLAKQP